MSPCQATTTAPPGVDTPVVAAGRAAVAAAFCQGGVYRSWARSSKEKVIILDARVCVDVRWLLTTCLARRGYSSQVGYLRAPRAPPAACVRALSFACLLLCLCGRFS